MIRSADAQADLSSLGAQVVLWFCHAAAQIQSMLKFKRFWIIKNSDKTCILGLNFWRMSQLFKRFKALKHKFDNLYC